MKKLLAGIILIVVSLMVGGFMTLKLWNWFMVDVFGLSEISYLLAMGMYIFVTSFQGSTDKEYDTISDMVFGLFKSVFLQLSLVLIGYIVYLLM